MSRARVKKKKGKGKDECMDTASQQCINILIYRNNKSMVLIIVIAYLQLAGDRGTSRNRCGYRSPPLQWATKWL